MNIILQNSTLKYLILVKNPNMGASCSSSARKKYSDVINYLRSKDCATYTYLTAFSPIYAEQNKAPHIIIIGESHSYNPAISLPRGERNCSTFVGILNDMVSICSNPVTKTTVFLENYGGFIDQNNPEERKTRDVFLDIPDTENPFNVNRQQVLSDHFRNKYSKNSIDVIDSDMFYPARSDLIISKKQNMSTISVYTIDAFGQWLNMNYMISDVQYESLKSSGFRLSNDYMSLFNDEMRQDPFLNIISLFGHIVLLFLKINLNNIFNIEVYNHIREEFLEHFNEIEIDFSNKNRKKRCIDGNQKDRLEDHTYAIGIFITYITDCINFHLISKTRGIVLISYGQHHAQNFEEMVNISRVYNEDFGDVKARVD